MDDSKFGVVALLIAAHSTIKEKNLIPDFEFRYCLANRLHHPGPVTTQDKGKAVGVKTTLSA